MEENPAADPTRPWSHDLVDDVDAELFLKTLKAPAARTLRYLCQHPGEQLSVLDVARATGAHEEDVRSHVVRVNKYSEAHGHVPLLADDQGLISVSPEASRVFDTAFEKLFGK
ncbi:hypothetical protein ACQEU5_18555 [Marinactinospora thermotolerans]|uniref:hypothetical protein n=1 Tax=Marinactinospora thermotolerans TaxID=531310 RepID=UPI001185429B|nr:hypothetical protein [Marinactinospora thermotolerans]